MCLLLCSIDIQGARSAAALPWRPTLPTPPPPLPTPPGGRAETCHQGGQRKQAQTVLEFLDPNFVGRLSNMKINYQQTIQKKVLTNNDIIQSFHYNLDYCSCDSGVDPYTQTIPAGTNCKTDCKGWTGQVSPYLLDSPPSPLFWAVKEYLLGYIALFFHKLRKMEIYDESLGIFVQKNYTNQHHQRLPTTQPTASSKQHQLDPAH